MSMARDMFFRLGVLPSDFFKQGLKHYLLVINHVHEDSINTNLDEIDESIF